MDDVNFAKIWVENRSEFRPRSKYVLRIELLKKGVSNEIIEDTLENIDDSDLAKRAAKQQARKYQMLEWKDFRKKLIAFLNRRGFTYSVIQGLAENIWEEINTPTYN